MMNEQIIIRGKSGDKDIRPESVKPTIIIGIGGSGGDVLLRIRKRFYEKYGALAQFPIVSYLWIDTDATDKAIPNSAAISEQIAFANNEKVMTTIADTTKYTSDLNTYPHIKQWFYPGLSKLKTMNEGAGQIRAYSRLGFFDHFSDIRQAIINAAARVRNVENIKAVRDKHHLDVDPSNLQVFVVFSVAGGTGSGMFLDVAFLVKDLFKGEKLTNVGVVMMPGLFNPTEDRVFANGYAALKELEHYSYEHDFEVQWPDGFRRKIEGPPFNYTYLIDRTNSASQSVEFANRDTIFNMVAENIFRDFTQGDFAGYKRGVRVNLDQYMYDTFGFGHLNDRGESVLDQKFITRYGSFGMASITVPADRIEQACAYRLAADVVDHWGSLSNSGYKAATLTEEVLQKLMPKVNIYEGNASVNGKIEERRDIQAALLDDGRKQGQRMDQLIEQSITQAGREVRDGVHRQRNQEMAHYLRGALDRERAKLRNDHPDPQQWGDYSRAVHFNKEAMVFDAQQRLRGEVNAIINEQHQSVGYVIALLRQMIVVLRHEDHAYLPKFERARDAAVRRAEDANRDLEQLFADIARHERKWNIPGTGQKKAILDADIDRFERLAPVHLGSLLKAQAHNAAIEFCQRFAKYVGAAETNDKGEQVNEGLIGDLFTLGGQLEELRTRLLERYAHFRQVNRGELSLYLYDESDIEYSYLPKYLGTGAEARRHVESIGDQILQELNTSVVDLPALVREQSMAKVEARIRDLARVPFRGIKTDFDVIESFWKKFPNETARLDEVRFVYRNSKFWLGGGNRGRSYALQSERHKIIVGIPEETRDKSKLAEFEQMLRQKFPEQGDPTLSIYKLTDRSEVVFYSEVGGIPINWADTVAELRRKYLKKQAEGEELHTDRNEIKFADLVVLEDDERKDLEEAHECFLLGLIFGEIWPDPDNTGRTQYKWRKRRNIISKEISLGIEPRALAELISKAQTRQDILKEINRRLEKVYNDRQALARFNALLAWYSTEIYPDQKKTGGDGQEYIEMSNMGRAVNKYMDRVTDHVEAQERRRQGTVGEFNESSRSYFDSVENFTDSLYDGKRALRAEAMEPAPATSPHSRLHMTNTGTNILCFDCGTPYGLDAPLCPECGLKNPYGAAEKSPAAADGAKARADVSASAQGLVREVPVNGAAPSRADISPRDGGTPVTVREAAALSDRTADPKEDGDPHRRRADSSRLPFLAAGLVLTLLVLGVVGWYWYNPAGRAQDGMVYVKGGKYTMGRDDGDEFERPAHEVVISPFYIDKSEVTCEQYQKFVEATGHKSPPLWGGSKCPAGAAKLPVTGVDWDDADTYARWAGKRLPTEEEWEFAARGEEGRLYPWGDRWAPGMANAAGDSRGGLAEAGKFKGASPFGAYDLIGNAWEWTASDLEAYPGGHLPEVPEGELKVIRGGSWREGEYATGSYRAYLKPRNDADYSATGFRCAQDAGRQR